MMAYALDYHAQWMIVVSLCVFFFISQWVAPRFGLSASLLMGACAYSAIWVWVWKDNRYLMVDPYNQMALRYFACDSIAKIMMIAVPMMLFSKQKDMMLMMGEFAASVFVVMSSLYALWEARSGCGGNRCGGFIGNPSISMGFMVSLLPTFVHSWRKQWPVIALALAAIFVSQSSVAVGLFAVYAALHFLQNGVGRRSLLQAGAVGAAALGAFAYLSPKGLLHDSDRFKTWLFMFDRWRAPGNILTGTGLGTYHVFSINLQNFRDPATGSVIHHFAPGYWWETMHNDPLQMLFECGVVGALLLLATYLSALIKVCREGDRAIAMSIILYGLYACMDPALHNPLPVLFGAWLFVYALRKPTKEYL